MTYRDRVDAVEIHSTMPHDRIELLILPKSRQVMHSRNCDYQFDGRKLSFNGYEGRLGLPPGVSLEVNALYADISGELASPAIIKSSRGCIDLVILRTYESTLKLCASPGKNGSLFVDGKEYCDSYGDYFYRIKKALINNVAGEFKKGPQGTAYLKERLWHLSDIEFCSVFEIAYLRTIMGAVHVSRKTKPSNLVNSRRVLDWVQKKAFPKTYKLRRQLKAMEMEELYENAGELHSIITALESAGKM